MLCQIKNLMIATHNKATGGNPGRQGQQSGQGGQTGSSSSDSGNQGQQSGASRGSQQGQQGQQGKINREVCLIVIARDSKAICPTVTVSRASKKKLLQMRDDSSYDDDQDTEHQNKKPQTGMRTQIAA